MPIRFDADTVEAVQTFADEHGMTVSSWIRGTVEREVKMRAVDLAGQRGGSQRATVVGPGQSSTLDASKWHDGSLGRAADAESV